MPKLYVLLSLLLAFGCTCSKEKASSSAGTSSAGTARSEELPEMSEDEKALVRIVERYASEVGELRDELCACKDKPCVERVDQQLDGVAIRFMEFPVPPEQDKVLTEIGGEIMACRKRLGAEYVGLMRPIGGPEASGKAMEAEQLLRKLYDGVLASYQENERKLWDKNAGPQPPLGTCCKSGGTCKPDEQRWTKEPWHSFYFAIPFDSHYSYEYRVKNASGAKAAFEVLAYGDLDCDGDYSTYRLKGTVDDEFGGFDSFPDMERTKALE